MRKCDAIDALNTGGPICVQQTQQASSCFAGPITATEDYETKSSSPVKITVAWSRGQAASNLEIHVYDHAHKELAAATTDDGNVQRVFEKFVLCYQDDWCGTSSAKRIQHRSIGYGLGAD